ncbi:MAG: peptide deformylase [Microgenomates group bacterium Gr01-1014_80]|nr:MAG: peptide deformylase [Microgenomates group bacterium Gr01-1014_80]
MQVLKAPNPLLRIQTKPVRKITPGLLQTFKDMIKLTKTFKDPEGVGLASTQIGLDGQYFVAKVDGSARTRKQVGDTTHLAGGAPNPARSHLRGVPNSEVNKDGKFITVINPKITWTSKKTKIYFEGCLSIPNYWGETERYLGIKVTYMDETGKVIKANLKGVMAWIFQHEVDHLNGRLFMDRVLEQKGKFYKNVGKDKTGADIFEEINL